MVGDMLISYWTGARPEDDAPAQNTSTAQKAAYERKIEKKENLMETVVMHSRSLALAVIERLPSNMKSATLYT